MPISGLVGQLTYFYTDKVGLAAGAVATAFLIVKILDAFTDLIMGYIVDHTAPGKERYRPWLLRMAIPAAIMIVLLFTVPAGISSTAQMVYMFVTNFLLTAVIYTAICIPYSSLQVVRTASQQERGYMGTWRAGAGYVAGMIIAVAIIPITNMLGGDQMAWIKFSAVLAVLTVICLLISYKTNKETNPVMEKAEGKPAENDEAIPFRRAIVNLFHNKYWVMILIMGSVRQYYIWSGKLRRHLLCKMDLRKRQSGRHPGSCRNDSDNPGICSCWTNDKIPGRDKDAACIFLYRNGSQCPSV